ncbi:unnamed protein product, partial [Aphanomyces euteiches]
RQQHEGFVLLGSWHELSRRQHLRQDQEGPCCWSFPQLSFVHASSLPSNLGCSTRHGIEERRKRRVQPMRCRCRYDEAIPSPEWRLEQGDCVGSQQGWLHSHLV